MSVGTWVFGLLNGLTIGMLAVGLVLIYKSNRFLNLAQAQLGVLSALLLQKWVQDWGWNWWLSFLVAIAVGIATGFLAERFVIAPLRRRSSSAVRLLLVSLAVSQVLLGLTYIPVLNPDASHASVYPQPFGSHVHVGPVLLTGTSILTAVLIPVLALALAAFMRYSVTGKQIRAAANNPDAARLCGISVNRVSAITWLIAGGLSAVAAVLAAPTQPGFNVASLGPYLLFFTLGAAAFGAFVSLPAALGGGIVLGLVSQIAAALTSNGSDGELAVFAAVLLVILVRGRAIGRAFAVSGPAVEDRPPVRVPKTLQSSAFVRHHWALLAGGGIALGVVWPQLPYFHTLANEFTLSLILIFAIVGVGLTMLLGWSGQVSLGNFALVGVGAYLTAHWVPHNWSLPALFLVVGLVCAAAMVIVGLPALRVPGLTLAVTTLGFAVIAEDWLYHQSWIGSSQPFGLTLTSPPLGPDLGTPHSPLSIYYVALGVLVLAVGAGAALRRSVPGRTIVAVRDNERASSAFGIAPATVKLATLAVSGFFAGMAGVLWADTWKAVSPTQFSADLSLGIIAIPVIGGLGSLGGAAAAAVLLYGITFFVGPSVSSLFGNFGQSLAFGLVVAGLGQIAILMRLPTGLAGAAQAGWQRYLDRRAARSGSVSLEETPSAAPPVVLQAEPARAVAVEPTADASEVALEPTADASEVALEVKGVSVRFGGHVALDQPDLCVRAGEVVGLIGTNGAGKTTLMNVISGFQQSDTGSVEVFGHEVADLPPDFRAAYGVARSFQDARLFAGLTVTETIQVALGRRNKVGMVSAMLAAPWAPVTERRTRRQAAEIVERFGLSPWADVQTSQLSTGTRRICDLAAQVTAEPKLLLLDEPTAGVAQREAEAFGPLLRRIRDELDCAILIVEHDMPLLMQLCDRLYALEAGRVIAEGTPDEIRHNPSVVASYLGTREVAISRSGATPATSGQRRRRLSHVEDGAKLSASRRTSMTPFQAFRLWCRRAPVIQRLAAATGAMAVLAALVWTVVPAGPQSASGSSATGLNRQALSATTTTSPATTSSTVATTSSTLGTAHTLTGGAGVSTAPTSATPGAAAAPAAGHCVSPPGSAPGVTATQINIGLIITNIAGPAADSTFGISSPQNQQAAFQAVINNINASGGVACRKLVPQYFTLDPVDQNGLQQGCLTIQQAGVFAVLDTGAYANYATGLTCYAQNHIPVFEGYDYSAQLVQQLYPYLFAFDTLDSAYKDSVLGLKQVGFFGTGFSKLGIIYRNCYPQLETEELSWLSQVGVSSSQISTYNMGCPSAFASPSDIENAIIQFKEAGVTNMTEVDELGDIANFTTVAQSQGFTPKWGLADDGLLEISNGSEAPNSSNLNGAIAIAASRNGENHTPSLSPTAGTQKCNAIMQTVGLAPLYSQAAATGNACDQLWMFQDAVDNAPALSPTALAAGLQKTASIDFSYPQGPNNFTASGSTVGGEFWRTVQYSGACSCWQVTNPNWSPSF